MIRQFLNHYSFCQSIIVYDNCSTDLTVEIIKEVRPDAQIISFASDNKINNHKFCEIKNKAWQMNREFDWQIIVDVDEILHNPYSQDGIPGYLHMMKVSHPHVSLIPTVGFNAHLDSFTEDFNKQMDAFSFAPIYGKYCIFNPKKIKEINYKIGAHECLPTGFNTNDVGVTNAHLFLLHYRYFGFEDWKKRNDEYAVRVDYRIPGASMYTKFQTEIKTEEDYKKEFELNRIHLGDLMKLKGTRQK